jgi:hypothetical protein
MDDRLMDSFIKNKFIEGELTEVPEAIKQRVKNTINELPKVSKRTVSVPKIMARASGVALVMILISTLTFGAEAKNLIRELNKTYKVQEELYNKYSANTLAKDSHNNIEMGITAVIYEGSSMKIRYYIKTPEKIEESLNIGEFQLYIDKERYQVKASSSSMVTGDSRIYEGETKLNISDIPEKFRFQLKVDSIDEVKGDWNFSLNLNREDLKEDYKFISVDKTEKLGDIKYSIGTIISNAIETKFTVWADAPKGYKAIDADSSKAAGFNYINDLLVTDEKRNIVGKANGDMLSRENDNNQTIKYNIYCRRIELPKELNIVPVKVTPRKNIKSMSYSLKGKTSMNIEDKELGSFNLSDIERTDDALTFKLKGNLNKENIYLPMLTLKAFNTDEIHTSMDVLDSANALRRGDTLEFKFTGLKKGKNYKLSYTNYFNLYEYEENSKINIPLK